MNISTYLLVLFGFAGAIAAPQPIDDLKPGVRTLSDMTREVQLQMSDVAAEWRNKDSLIAGPSEENELFDQLDVMDEISPNDVSEQPGLNQQNGVEKTRTDASGRNMSLALSASPLQSTFSSGCQSGVVGTRDFKGVKHSWPKEYRVTFKPAFKTTPHLVYGITLLEANSYTYVDVYTYYFTRDQVLFSIKTSSSYNRYLYGVQISWMACP